MAGQAPAIPDIRLSVLPIKIRARAVIADPEVSQGEHNYESATPPSSTSDARLSHEQPLVAPQVVHFMHVPLRTRVKLPHSPQASPS